MKLDRLVWVGATFILVGGLGSLVYPQASLPPEVRHFADVVFYNGKVLTADDAFTIAQAVAIRDGKFLAVGESVLPIMFSPRCGVIVSLMVRL